MTKTDRHAALLVELTRSALTHSPLPEVEESARDGLCALIFAHKLEGLLYPVLRGTDTVLTAEQRERMHKEFLKAQLRDATQTDAFEEIAQAFAENNIRFMPMKGLILKNIFDKPYHRMMGDLDILIDPEHRRKAREIMEGLGYQTESYEEWYDDVYYRRPILNIEIHIALGKEEDLPEYPYFDGVWERAVPSSKYPLCFEMAPMDYYLYFVFHAYRHCQGHGTGIRTVIDWWMLEKRYLPKLDPAQLADLLEKLKMTTFEAEMRRISAVWFDGVAGDEFQGETMRHFLILDGGMYGNFENAVFRQTIEGEDVSAAHAKKRKIFLSHVFLPLAGMKKKYTVLNRHKWLLPFCWVHRIIKTLFAPDKVKGEVRFYRKVSDGMDRQAVIRRRFGFTQTSDSPPRAEE